MVKQQLLSSCLYYTIRRAQRESGAIKSSRLLPKDQQLYHTIQAWYNRGC
jgi:hypothetical protein